jgi:addiction module HigA family antidote
MTTEVLTYEPDYVSLPGETLAEVLEDRGLSQAEFARRTGLSKKTINEIVQGKTPITSESAIKFEMVLGIAAAFWLKREADYQANRARHQHDEHLAHYGTWLQQFPIKAMINAAYIAPLSETHLLVRAVLSFFRIAHPDQFEPAISSVMQRRVQRLTSDQGALSAWLQRGIELAEAIEYTPFAADQFKQALQEARDLTTQPFDVVRQQLTALCQRAGVAVVILPELPHTRICGIARWLPNDKPLIQLSIRYQTNDQFWFTFFHEAAHILLHRRRNLFIDEELSVVETETDEEREANDFARDLLIPPVAWQTLIEQINGQHISGAIVEQFAQAIGIAPGIVVGRLQHAQLLPASHLNKLKEKLRFASTPDQVSSAPLQ